METTALTCYLTYSLQTKREKKSRRTLCRAIRRLQFSPLSRAQHVGKGVSAGVLEKRKSAEFVVSSVSMNVDVL